MLTARIEGALSGKGVVIKSPDHLEDKVAGGTREVDVSLRCRVGSVDVVVIVECRDRGRSADVTWIEQVKTKRDAVGASKAVAVATGMFSKKATRAANRYGIDLRTIMQVNRSEVRRWTGAVQMFPQQIGFTNTKITVRVAGIEPLDSVASQFDELVRANGLGAPFISYPAEVTLLSPLDVIRRIKIDGQQQLGAGRVTIVVPPHSSMLICDDPAMMALVGDPPPNDGTAVERQSEIQFEQGEAFFKVGNVTRPLLVVQLQFSVRLEEHTAVEGESYRYESSSGVIEVAERQATFGDRHLIIMEHRREPSDI
jgi:hypothetical protein